MKRRYIHQSSELGPFIVYQCYAYTHYKSFLVLTFVTKAHIPGVLTSILCSWTGQPLWRIEKQWFALVVFNAWLVVEHRQNWHFDVLWSQESKLEGLNSFKEEVILGLKPLLTPLIARNGRCPTKTIIAKISVMIKSLWSREMVTQWAL